MGHPLRFVSETSPYDSTKAIEIGYTVEIFRMKSQPLL